MTRTVVLARELLLSHNDSGWYRLEWGGWMHSEAELARAVRNLEAHIEIIAPPPATGPALDGDDYHRTVEGTLEELKETLLWVKERSWYTTF